MNFLPAPILAVVAGWLWPGPDASYRAAILAVAAAAPELWRATGAFSARLAVRIHRGAGHSIFVLAAWALALAAAFHRFDPRPGFGTAFALSGLGVAVHMLVHLASPSGIALLGRRRFALSLFAPQDVLAIVLPTLALGVGAGWPAARLPVAIGTCLLLLYATGLRMTMRARAERLGAEALGEGALCFPTPWSPFRWICVAPDLRAVRVDVAKKAVGEVHRCAPAPEAAIVEDLRGIGAIPAAGEGGWIVDLRYGYDWPTVVAGVRISPDGKPLRARLP